jgi:hypothetical protein
MNIGQISYPKYPTIDYIANWFPCRIDYG